MVNSSKNELLDYLTEVEELGNKLIRSGAIKKTTPSKLLARRPDSDRLPDLLHHSAIIACYLLKQLKSFEGIYLETYVVSSGEGLNNEANPTIKVTKDGELLFVISSNTSYHSVPKAASVQASPVRDELLINDLLPPPNYPYGQLYALVSHDTDVRRVAMPNVMWGAKSFQSLLFEINVNKFLELRND